MVKYQLWILLTIFLFFYSIATLSAIRHPVLINDRHNIDSLCPYASPNHPVYRHFVDFACTFPYYSHLQPWFSWTFNKLTYLQVISHLNFCWSVLYLLFSGSLHLQYFMEQLCKFSCPDYSIVAALMNWLQDFIKFSRYIGNKLLGK